MGTKQLFTGGSSGTTLTVAIVSNSQMQDAISLSHLFESEHPGIHLNFISLPENEARAKITADVSTQGGEFDVVMISNYETPMWSANGWLVNLQPYINATPGYDAERLPAPAAGDPVAQGRPVLGAVLRRVLVPHVPQGPDGQGGHQDAGPAHLDPGGRRSPPRCITPRRDGSASACAATRAGGRTWRRSTR